MNVLTIETICIGIQSLPVYGDSEDKTAEQVSFQQFGATDTIDIVINSSADWGKFSQGRRYKVTFDTAS